MRKFVTVAATTAVLAAGIAVPSASAENLFDAAKCEILKAKLQGQDMLRGDDTTVGELTVNLEKKDNSFLLGAAKAFFTNNFNTDGSKKDNAKAVAQAAAKCGLVKSGVLPELSAVTDNLSSVGKSQSGEKKDKDGWSFSDVFEAFSSGISS